MASNNDLNNRTITQAPGNNTTLIASTAFVTAALAALQGIVPVLLETQVASASAFIAFTGLTSTYSQYIVEMDNVISANDAVSLYLTFGTGGTPTYATTGYYWNSIFLSGASGNYADDGATNTSQIILGITAAASYGYGTGTRESASGTIKFFRPASGNLRALFNIQQTTASPLNGYFTGGGSRDDATAITAVKFAMSAGNIASGTFKLWGLK